MNFDKEKIGYTTSQAVKATGINRNKLQLYREQGLLEAVKVGTSYVYSKKTLENFFETWAGFELKNAEDIKIAKIKKGARVLQQVH